MAVIANRVAHLGTSVFTEINELAQKHNAVNLGQGKPDFDAPQDVVARAVSALQDGVHNQYAPGSGISTLRKAVADHAGRFYNMDIDPAQGVVVTAGASEGLFASILALVDAGDEVIIIEPYFDLYLPAITMTGAVPVYVPLHPPHWTFDPDELRAAFTPKTRVLLMNTPQNPTGRVFTREELTMIAELCIEHDVTVISDEVYEHLLFGSARHIPIATLPDMFERTVTISSGGKTFSSTGWKVGWAYGHPELIRGVLGAHQFITFAVHHASQEAIAYALNLSGTYYEELQAMYEGKRQLMMAALRRSGMTFAEPEGTYFVMADFSEVFDGTPTEFAKHLITEYGVGGIPPESFYCDEHKHLGMNYLRFAFCKSDDLLREAGERLARLKR
ncbi:MAG: aminotransferase class I/II-fold pyridoxal phosphate-dependent enzyme [Anaerolineae bacterium]